MASRSPLPLLVYDGDCKFCRLWIDRWKGLTEDQVAYAPFQEIADRFPEIPPENFAKSVQLILPNGQVFSGAHAVFRALAYAPGKRWMLWMYEKIPGVAPVCEWFYRFIAERRGLFYRLTRFLWGKHFERPSYILVRWLFLRSLGVIYLMAFLSLRAQIIGLIGQDGILPASSFLQALQKSMGSERYWFFPTLAWFNADDAFLRFLGSAGVFFSFLVILDVLTAPALAVLWILYLSLVVVSQDFLSFQWDALLLETGFLAIFFAPIQILPGLSRQTPPSPTVLWLLRWLLFRLMFGSGVVKLASGDATWRNLTALSFHYETQPLPTPISWYMHQLPGGFQKVSVVVMFAIELLVPFLIFTPRRLRFVAAGLIAFLQVGIFLTGNYTFFNLLALALCLILLDDTLLGRFFPRPWGAQMVALGAQGRKPFYKRFLVAALAGMILGVSGLHVAGMFMRRKNLPGPALQVLARLEPFRIVNSYGLFAVMTTSRPEIIVEGSYDGETWLEYEFKYKPGDVKRAPRWVAPHQPRLDWQMWFAALGNYSHNPWFVNFLVRLLQGSPEVLALLGKNPFPDAPPRYVRALLYDYHFTDFATLRAEGAWWRRELKGWYFPVASLRE